MKIIIIITCTDGKYVNESFKNEGLWGVGSACKVSCLVAGPEFSLQSSHKTSGQTDKSSYNPNSGDTETGLSLGLIVLIGEPQASERSQRR